MTKEQKFINDLIKENIKLKEIIKLLIEVNYVN